MKNQTGDRWGVSFLLYLGVGLVAFFPCLFGGQVGFDGDLLNCNPMLRHFLRDNLAAGRLPLWNPYLFGGQPFFADPNTMAFHPFLYLSLLFPTEYGYGVFYLICFMVGALGMHLWLKSLKLGEDSCRFGALLFALSGYFWWEIIHPPELAAFAWTPWWAAALEKASQKLESVWFFVAGLVLAVLFTAGNFQLTMGVLYGGAAYLAFRTSTRRDWCKEKDKDQKLLLAPVFFIWGALPLLVFWIPAWEMMSRCDRLTTHLDYANFLADYSLRPSRLWQFLFPVQPFPQGAVVARPMDDYLANGGYLGPWALFLMVLAFRRPEKKYVYFMAAAGTAALSLAAGKYLPVHWWACQLVPGIGLARAPFRYVFLYVAAGSVLAALGYETLKECLERSRSQKGRPWFWMGAVAYVLLVLAISWGQGKEVWPQYFGLALGFLCFCAWGFKAWREVARRFFQASLVLTLLATGWIFGTTRWGPPLNFDWEGNCPALVTTREIAGLGRALIGDNIPYPVQTDGVSLSLSVPTDVSMAIHIRNALGYSPLCLAKVSDLFALPPVTFARLMALKDFVTGDPKWHIAGFDYEVQGRIRICVNQETPPFVYAPRRIRTISEDGERLKAMGQADFNPYEQSYFSEPVTDFTAPVPAKLQYALKTDQPDEEAFAIDIDRSNWVVVSEVMFPGWRAWVDGKPAELYTANHSFRSAWVPSGHHELLFRYEPVWAKPLFFGLIAWVFSVLCLALGPGGQKFREPLRF